MTGDERRASDTRLQQVIMLFSHDLIKEDMNGFISISIITTTFLLFYTQWYLIFFFFPG